MSKGTVRGINGNLVQAQVNGVVSLNEIAFIKTGDVSLKSEVIRINDDRVEMQVFESTNGLKVGDAVEFSGELLNVELGPGLLGMIYDGLQTPLTVVSEQAGFFLPRGVNPAPLSHKKKWDFTPVAKKGDRVEGGDTIATVPEGMLTHKVMVPFYLSGHIRMVKPAGQYTIDDTIAEIEDTTGKLHKLTMVFRWPVKRPIMVAEERLRPDEPLVTKVRIIDSFLPIARGGTYCIPGPFGAGKTVLQHITSRNADVDIVVIAACGERAGEVVEVLREFPEIIDPKTGRSLMERTVIICNTSSMPVAAREASVYTGVTIAEYYRQMGLDVLLLADSTSRWAQAMREMSGRLEEIPGEESFPAYLESVIAAFYERAGVIQLRDGSRGSVTIGGTVSPAGGNFEEPVTQSTLKVVGAFHGLSRARAEARRYPSIHPLESWSRYPSFVETETRELLRSYLSRGNEVAEMMKVIGEEGTSIDDYLVYLKSEFVDAVFLQQNAFDPVDQSVSKERQQFGLDLIVTILQGAFDLQQKEEARKFFNRLRQLFLDLNVSEWQSAAFKEKEKVIRALLTEVQQKVN